MWLLDTNALIKFKKEKFKIESSSYNLYTTIFNIIEFPPSLNFDFLVILYPKLQTFEKALNYSVYLREKGTPLSIIDILIATIAVENNLKIVTDDQDFDILNLIEPKLYKISFEQFLKEIKL